MNTGAAQLSERFDDARRKRVDIRARQRIEIVAARPDRGEARSIDMLERNGAAHRLFGERRDPARDDLAAPPRQPVDSFDAGNRRVDVDDDSTEARPARSLDGGKTIVARRAREGRRHLRNPSWRFEEMCLAYNTMCLICTARRASFVFFTYK